MMRRMPMQEVIRMVLMGNDERLSAATAKQIGLVGEVVGATSCAPRAHALAPRSPASHRLAVQSSLKASLGERRRARRSRAAARVADGAARQPIGTAQVDRSASGRGLHPAMTRADQPRVRT